MFRPPGLAVCLFVVILVLALSPLLAHGQSAIAQGSLDGIDMSFVKDAELKTGGHEAQYDKSADGIVQIETKSGTGVSSHASLDSEEFRKLSPELIALMQCDSPIKHMKQATECTAVADGSVRVTLVVKQLDEPMLSLLKAAAFHIDRGMHDPKAVTGTIALNHLDKLVRVGDVLAVAPA